MIVYTVEGDHGHLLNGEMQNQKGRTVVRGGCASYRMPWEDIIETLQQNVRTESSRPIPFGKNA